MNTQPTAADRASLRSIVLDCVLSANLAQESNALSACTDAFTEKFATHTAQAVAEATRANPPLAQVAIDRLTNELYDAKLSADKWCAKWREDGDALRAELSDLREQLEGQHVCLLQDEETIKDLRAQLALSDEIMRAAKKTLAQGGLQVSTMNPSDSLDQPDPSQPISTVTTSATMNPSDTPRTDSEEWTAGHGEDDSTVVWSDFVRTLERELKDASMRGMKVALDAYTKDLADIKAERDTLAAQLKYGTETGEPCAEIVRLSAQVRTLRDALENCLPQVELVIKRRDAAHGKPNYETQLDEIVCKARAALASTSAPKET